MTSRFQSRRQRGATLLFALLTLVALMLSTLALVRSVDTGTLVLGNIGFKQDATAAADQATRQAILWLTNNNASLNTDVANSGYYATNRQYDIDGTTLLGALDVTGHQLATTATRQLINWDGDGCATFASGTFGTCTLTSASAGAINGNETRFVVFRQCSKSGNYAVDNTISCAKPISSASGQSTKRGEFNYVDSARLSSAAGPYYRIVVRVKGARNTTSFTETIVHF
jgi:Tfp pilus assembly protein PilX